MTGRAIGERLDALLARPWAFTLFNVGWVLLLIADLNAANLFISVVTADLVLLQLASARADRCAAQAKLDELIAGTDSARNALMRAEDQDEASIAELRL